MKNRAVSQAVVKSRRGLFGAGLSFAMVGLLAVALGGTAAASPVGRNGEVRACYQVKGKEKGSMRVVAGKHCRPGERKLAWSIVGPSGVPGSEGAAGASGSQGSPGQSGSDGSSGSAGLTAATVSGLEDKISSLTGELNDLKGTLTGIADEQLTLNGTISDLTTEVGGVQGLLAGVGVGDLTKLKSNVGVLCTQTGKVTDQVNAVGSVVNNLLGGLGGIPLIGNILGGETAPTALVKVPCTP